MIYYILFSIMNPNNWTDFSIGPYHCQAANKSRKNILSKEIIQILNSNHYIFKFQKRMATIKITVYIDLKNKKNSAINHDLFNSIPNNKKYIP